MFEASARMLGQDVKLGQELNEVERIGALLEAYEELRTCRRQKGQQNMIRSWPYACMHGSEQDRE